MHGIFFSRNWNVFMNFWKRIGSVSRMRFSTISFHVSDCIVWYSVCSRCLRFVIMWLRSGVIIYTYIYIYKWYYWQTESMEKNLICSANEMHIYILYTYTYIYIYINKYMLLLLATVAPVTVKFWRLFFLQVLIKASYENLKNVY